MQTSPTSRQLSLANVVQPLPSLCEWVAKLTRQVLPSLIPRVKFTLGLSFMLKYLFVKLAGTVYQKKITFNFSHMIIFQKQKLQQKYVLNLK